MFTGLPFWVTTLAQYREDCAGCAVSFTTTVSGSRTTEGLAVTYQIGEKKNEMASTGLGTVKKDRQFLYHPDDIKRLSTGEAVYMSKDTGEHTKLHIRKGF